MQNYSPSSFFSNQCSIFNAIIINSQKIPIPIKIAPITNPVKKTEFALLKKINAIELKSKGVSKDKLDATNFVIAESASRGKNPKIKKTPIRIGKFFFFSTNKNIKIANKKETIKKV